MMNARPGGNIPFFPLGQLAFEHVAFKIEDGPPPNTCE